MAPYLENAVLAHPGELSTGTASPLGCTSQQVSPTPGSLPPTESPPGLVSMGVPYIESATSTETPVQNCVMGTTAYAPSTQQSYPGSLPSTQHIVVTTAQPVVTTTQPYQAVQGNYVCVQPQMQPAPIMVAYPATAVPVSSQPVEMYQQPVTIAIPQHEPQVVQYIQAAPAPANSPVQYQMGPPPVQHEGSPVLSNGSPSPHYPRHLAPEFTQQPAQQPSPMYMTPQPMYSGPQQGVIQSMPSQSTDDLPALREGESISTQLEVIWHGTFRELFDKFPMKWRLMPVTEIPSDAKTFMDSAKVRFICPNCSHCWTSMKGRVTFGYSVDNLQKEGLVVFRLYGQKCLKCQSPDWVHSMWYEEEVKKVIHNIHQKISMDCYNKLQPRLRIERRKGRPSKPHDQKFCQACAEGICREERNYS